MSLFGVTFLQIIDTSVEVDEERQFEVCRVKVALFDNLLGVAEVAEVGLPETPVVGKVSKSPAKVGDQKAVLPTLLLVHVGQGDVGMAEGFPNYEVAQAEIASAVGESKGVQHEALDQVFVVVLSSVESGVDPLDSAETLESPRIKADQAGSVVGSGHQLDDLGYGEEETSDIEVTEGVTKADVDPGLVEGGKVAFTAGNGEELDNKNFLVREEWSSGKDCRGLNQKTSLGWVSRLGMDVCECQGDVPSDSVVGVIFVALGDIRAKI
jgi:hypothetical protein